MVGNSNSEILNSKNVKGFLNIIWRHDEEK
jgi:hypothetical protein